MAALPPEEDEFPLPPLGDGLVPPPDDALDQDGQHEEEQQRKKTFHPKTLEDACVMAYLKYLENEVVTYISLTQSKSRLVKGVSKRMLELLKQDINCHLRGVASSVLREKMISLILSKQFPSVEHCNIFIPPKKENDDSEEAIIPSCPNICCTGAFIQEAMLGVVLSAEVRQLVFTASKVKSRREFPSTPHLNVPVILTHLIGATDGRVSLLERIVFSENFVKQKTCHNERGGVRLPIDQSERQRLFCRSFGNIYDTAADRHGTANNLLTLFRDIRIKGGKFLKLTELILKNNIQCKLYSKANFQFDLLSRIGFCCPKLRVLDVFGTDTWADCLVALLFRDAFHSLHRYLFFMRTEDGECSNYHPHDTSRYCQFCLDQWHPNQIERPFTNNPVIPLLDCVYDHVITRYPKRAFCILRNCVRVSDLLRSTQATVFELVRPPRAPSCPACSCDSPRGRLKPKSHGARIALRSAPLCSCAQSCCTALSTGSTSTGSTGPGNLASRADNKLSSLGCSHKTHANKNNSSHEEEPVINNTDEGLAISNTHGGPSINDAQGQGSSTTNNNTDDPHVEQNDDGDEWVIGRRERTLSGKSDEVKNQDEVQGVMTRAQKRRKEKNETSEIAAKKSKEDKRPSSRAGKCEKRAKPTTGKSCKVVEHLEAEEEAGETTKRDVISHSDWTQESEERWTKFPPQSCPGIGPEGSQFCDQHDLWYEPESIQYREISDYPHLNPCASTLEILNIGGSNVLGEFVPFLLLHMPRLKSLGQWFNAMMYGLEILKDLPEHEDFVSSNLQEFSYSSDRTYFSRPYIGFVPESQEFTNVKKELVRYSASKSTRRCGHKQRRYACKRRQIQDDMELMANTCPELRKLNLVVHHTIPVLDNSHSLVWTSLLRLKHLVELDLVTMRFDNVRALLAVVGPQLEKLTVEFNDKQGNGSELVHIARHCTNVKSLRILLGDKSLRGDNTLHFGELTFFRKVEHLTVEGDVHLNAFAFLWAHCQALKYLKIGLVIADEMTNANVLIMDVFTALFRLNKMTELEEMHIRSLKVRSMTMAALLLDSLPSLKKASDWLIDGDDLAAFEKSLKKYKEHRGLQVEYKEW